MLARLNERFAAGLELHELFELRTVEQLAETIDARPQAAAPIPIRRAERRAVRIGDAAPELAGSTHGD